MLPLCVGSVSTVWEVVSSSAECSFAKHSLGSPGSLCERPFTYSVLLLIGSR